MQVQCLQPVHLDLQDGQEFLKLLLSLLETKLAESAQPVSSLFSPALSIT